MPSPQPVFDDNWVQPAETEPVSSEPTIEGLQAEINELRFQLTDALRRARYSENKLAIIRETAR